MESTRILAVLSLALAASALGSAEDAFAGQDPAPVRSAPAAPGAPAAPAAPAAPGALGRVELPAGPAARAFAGVASDTLAAALPRGPAAGLDAETWRTPAAWSAWAEAVRAEASAAASDPLRRAALAEIALAHARFDDAWDHFAATGGSPAVCAALLPRFLPGVPESAPERAPEQAPERANGARPSGGLAAPLPEGVLLRPAVPPPSVPAAEVLLGRAWIERREMRLEGLQVGAATLTMRVALQSDGIQVDFDHQAGGAASVRVLLPEPADFEVRVAYVDWMRQDGLGLPLEVRISPGDETHTLFGRLRPRTIAWPTNLPAALPRFVADHGLELRFSEHAPDADVFRAAGPALASVLGLPVGLAAPTGPAFAGVRIDLDDPAVARQKLTGMVTLAERFALRRPPR